MQTKYVETRNTESFLIPSSQGMLGAVQTAFVLKVIQYNVRVLRNQYIQHSLGNFRIQSYVHIKFQISSQSSM